jgi:hypothetical protein
MKTCYYILSEKTQQAFAVIEGNNIRYINKAYSEFKRETVDDPEHYLLEHGYQFAAEIFDSAEHDWCAN